ncbi:MAG: molybdopterin-dependent oxidoreductase [Acidobacteria bacterium]|nr:molybdopterin-dependent oxidoreductase [Acidobacteriota bacterium]
MATEDPPLPPDDITPPASWGRTTVHTACPLDCPDSCSLAVSLEGGHIQKIDGSHVAPDTGGFICGKVRGFDRRVYSAERVLYPSIRRGPKGRGDFTVVSWAEALDHIAEKMTEARETHGAESVLPFYYGGSNGLLTNEMEDARLFRRFGASRLARTVCAAPTGAAAMAMYGKMAGVGYSDYAHARLILVWGANPPASGIHLVAHIKQAQKNGAKLVVIDPRRTPLARTADLHLAVRPGTDLPVALAMIRELFESGRAADDFLAAHATGVADLREAAAPWTLERAADVAGVSTDDLRQLVEWYTTISPAVIRCGWGQERNRNGGAATMAMLALPAVAGKFGVRGGGYTMSNSGAYGLNAESWINTPHADARIVNMNQLGRALTEYNDPPVQVLFVYNCNPLSTMPDANRVKRGLEREDLFTVVYEQTMTDTAKYADVVLPATTFLEHYDVARGYGAYHLHIVRPVIEPVGDARPNHEVFRDLAVRLQLVDDDGDDLGEAEGLMEITSSLPDALGHTLHDGGVATGPAGGRPIQFVDVSPKTPDQKIHLFPDALESTAGLYTFQADPATETYPLALISPASEHTISSTLAEFRPGIAKLKMHPDDARPRAIELGDAVRVFNDLGEVWCHVDVTPEVRAGVVSLPKGLWARSTENGETSNALVPDTLTDLGGGACFNDARVQVALRAKH